MTEEDTHGLAAWASQGIEPDPVPAAPAVAPEPDPAPEPITAEADPVEPVVSAEPVVEAEPEPVSAPVPAKKPKAMEPWMKDRLAEQTAKQRDAERARDEATARAEVAEAALQALKRGDTAAPAQPVSAPPADYVPRSQVEAEAVRIATERAFVEQANAVYHTGKEGYSDFDAALEPLLAIGAIQRHDFQEAAIATGAGADVIYHLGSNPNEASEILSYLKAGQLAKATAKMTRIAADMSAAKTAAAKAKPVSKVPAPIRPLGGSAGGPALDWEKADDSQVDAEMSRMAKAGGWNW